jgi:2-phospho-L-lactate guanylyltransferase
MINIVIPMKNPTLSKQRLSALLSEKMRHDFALELFKINVTFLNRNFPQFHILVVTNSEYIFELSNNLGVSALIEQKEGLSNAVSAAAIWSEKNDFTEQLVIPADIAQLDVDEVSTLLTLKINEPSVIICPSQDNGTNALLTCPPNIIPFRYGKNSADKHAEVAHHAGIYCRKINLTKLAIDVDFPIDLQQVIHTKEISSLFERITA